MTLEKHKQVAQHLRSLQKLSEHIETERLGRLDSRDWKEDWGDRWVVYADLVAFASRATRSDAVVLNNIVRFDRACQIVSTAIPTVRLHRFSDATFAISNSFADAIAFAVGLSHSCLAFNYAHIQYGNKPFFIHSIVPRTTIANGRVLLIPDGPAKQPRYSGIDPKNIIAGSAIVRAYELQKQSAGGLITLDEKGTHAIRNLKVRGHGGRNTSGLKRWIRDLSSKDRLESGQVYGYRRKVLDLPWLLLQPVQNEAGSLWAATPAEADFAIAAYLDVWDKSVREFYSPQNFDGPLETVKHCQAGIRHALQSHYISDGRTKPAYESASTILTKLHERSAATTTYSSSPGESEQIG